MYNVLCNFSRQFMDYSKILDNMFPLTIIKPWVNVIYFITPQQYSKIKLLKLLLEAGIVNVVLIVQIMFSMRHSSCPAHWNRRMIKKYCVILFYRGYKIIQITLVPDTQSGWQRRKRLDFLWGGVSRFIYGNCEVASFIRPVPAPDLFSIC